MAEYTRTSKVKVRCPKCPCGQDWQEAAISVSCVADVISHSTMVAELPDGVSHQNRRARLSA